MVGNLSKFTIVIRNEVSREEFDEEKAYDYVRDPYGLETDLRVVLESSEVEVIRLEREEIS